MAFQLPSAASKRIVSILNTEEGNPADPQHIRPHTLNTPSTASTTAVPSPGGTDSGSSNGSSLFSNSTSWSSGGVSESTSVEPSPVPQPALVPSTKALADGERSEKHILRKKFSSSPAPMSDRPGHSAIKADAHPSDQPQASSSVSSRSAQDYQETGDCQAYREQSLSSHLASMHAVDTPSDDPSANDFSASVGEKKLKPSVVHGKKRYPCNHPGCDKTFSTSGHAARHNRIHTGQKPYRCTFPGCKASFSRQDNALAHFRTGHALAKPREGEDTDTAMGHPSNGFQTDSHIDASAEMGRRALEQGTAIAVVRDGKVERTVGLPKGRRCGSVSAYFNADFDDRRQSSMGPTGPTPAAEYAQHRSSTTSARNAPPNKLLERTAFTHAKPSSIHSDYEHRTNLPPLLTHSAAGRAHPYSRHSAQHRASVGGGRDDGYDLGRRFISKDVGGAASDRQRRLSHEVSLHGPSGTLRSSSGFAASQMPSHLLPGTIAAAPTRHMASALPFANTAYGGRSSRNELHSSGYAQNWPAKGTSPPNAASWPSHAKATPGSDSGSSADSHPEALLSLKSLYHSALPCSSDRTTTALDGNKSQYQPASPLENTGGPIRLPPLRLPGHAGPPAS
ncbi:unnamed protein product [Sympodiomycopsis kandeliae]